jgi:hypothetical protein
LADSVVGQTPGTGADIKTFLDASSDHVQYIRSHTGTAVTLDNWTTSTTAVTSRAAADETRVSLTFTNASTTDIYLRPDATAPTSSVYYVKIPANGLYEVPREWVELAWSVLAGASGVGSLLIWKGTAA